MCVLPYESALCLATSCLDDLTIIRDNLNAPHSAISLR